jgi:ABC-type sugar transport system substrate-binding protein
MAQIAKAAVGAGIAWGIINTDVDYISDLPRHALVPVFTVLSDHETIGKIQGQQIAALLSDQGCVLSLEGPSVRDVAKVRTKRMLATKPPQIVVKTLKGDWTQNSGYHAVKSWLSLTTSRQLNVSMIVGQNDDMAFGARRAFEELSDAQERDRWRRLPFAGMRRCCPIWTRMGSTGTAGGDRHFSSSLMGDAMQLLVSATIARLPKALW